MNKGGRPKAKNPKSEPFGFRANKAEAEQIRMLATARGISPGEFCRRAALDIEMPAAVSPDLNRDAWVELGRIGNNLNQLTRHANEGIIDEPGIRNVLDELYTKVRKLQYQVLGLNDSEY